MPCFREPDVLELLHTPRALAYPAASFINGLDSMLRTETKPTQSSMLGQVSYHLGNSKRLRLERWSPEIPPFPSPKASRTRTSGSELVFCSRTECTRIAEAGRFSRPGSSKCHDSHPGAQLSAVGSGTQRCCHCSLAAGPSRLNLRQVCN